MKSILSVLLMGYSLLSFGFVQELGTLCAVDCRYELTTFRATVMGEKQWSGTEQEQYYSARVSAKRACGLTGGKIPVYADPKLFSGYNGYNGYICCALEKVDGVLTPSRCPLLN